MRLISQSYITGTGLVSALGVDLPTTWNALHEGQYLSSHSTAKLSAETSASRVAALAAQAAHEAIASAGWSRAQVLDPSTAIVFGTSKGDITDWLSHNPKSDKTRPAGWTDSSFGLARVCEDLCDQLDRPAGPKITISAACASGLQALIRADMLLRSGAAERALVIASEASVHPLFLASFERLGVLATGIDPGRPFDEHRNGFRMSEAAAAVTLERRPPENRSTQVAVTFTGMAGDATHIVAGDPASRALIYLLNKAYAHRPIDIVHAHGTGTLLNDQIEAAAIGVAIEKAGRERACIYSHKGSLGHSLGASGLVSVVLANEMHQRNQSLPMTTTLTPMKVEVPTSGGYYENEENRDSISDRPSTSDNACYVKLSTGQRMSVANSLILANGFGGPQTAVVLSTIKDWPR